MPTQTSFQRLQKRSFGGEDVAARPGAEDDSWWPKGPLLAGVSELLSTFLKTAKQSSGLSLVFMLGGAGNGKSFVARELANQLGMKPQPSDTLARRAYATVLGKTSVEILNDATIAPNDDYRGHQDMALAADLTRWEKERHKNPVAAFCCVNRGIIIDELRAMEEAAGQASTFSRAVLLWLSSGRNSVMRALENEAIEFPSPAPADLRGLEYYREESFVWGGQPIWLAALSVDAASLFDSNDGEESRGRALFRQVLERCKDEASNRPLLCPVRANIQQWRNPEMLANWEEAMSCAEIGSGRPHSYREAWGLTTLSILGPRVADGKDASDILGLIDASLQASKDARTLESKLLPLLEVARFRAHEALFQAAFPSGSDFTTEYPAYTPAHLGLSLIDPSAWSSEDSSAVESAMQAIAVGEYPSKRLTVHNWLSACWSDFDAALEMALVDFVVDEECPDVVRRRLVSWWGGYMVRLAGLGSGRLGNARVIAAWRNCQQASLNGPALLPKLVESAIRSLLFPAQGGIDTNKVMIPAFAARVEPLRTSRDGPTATLAEEISHSAVALRVSKAGNKLLLECTLAGSAIVVGQLVLDFPLLREALACRDGRAGQTEATAFVEPRIERCRAATLQAMPGTFRRLVALSGGEQVELNV